MPSDAASPFATSDESPPLILIADDSEDVRALLKATLARRGFEVREAESAEGLIEAVNRLCEEGSCPDAIISDVSFFKSAPRAGARLTGIGAARKIHEVFRNLPILFVTGYNDRITRENAAGVGAEVLSKPFDPDELLTRVELMLQFRAAPRYEGVDRRRYGINATGNCRRRTDRRVELPETVAGVLSDLKTKAANESDS